MKLNINKVFFLILASTAIALCSIATVLSLLTRNIFLEICILILTFLSSFLLVKVRQQTPLFIKQ